MHDIGRALKSKAKSLINGEVNGIKVRYYLSRMCKSKCSEIYNYIPMRLTGIFCSYIMLIKLCLKEKSNMMRPTKKSAPIFSLALSSCDAETMFILLVIT